MQFDFISWRSWLVFFGVEIILAGVLLMLGAISGIFLVVIGAVLLTGLWTWDNRRAQALACFRQMNIPELWISRLISVSGAPRASRGDAELSQLRQRIRRLKETLLGFGNPIAERDAVLNTIEKLEQSQNAVWDDPSTWELRYDFLHACRTMQYVRMEVGPALVRRDAAEARALLIKTATELDIRLAG